MLFAGSVLAMLLAGLTVDALVSPLEEDDEIDNDAADPSEDAGVGLTSVGDLLDAADADAPDDVSMHGRAEALGYTPLDEVDDFADETADSAATAVMDIDEGGADVADEPGDDNHLHEVTETAALPDGSEVPLVTDFAADTDLLVMEFDGAEKDAPLITVQADPESDDMLVKANGHAITLVQDAPDLSEKHVSIVMSEAQSGPSAQPEPIVDLVEEISDGIPDADAIDAMIDDLGNELSLSGDTSDVLDARASIDPAFGTGGNDALTGTFEGDDLTGDDGQNALFGDEGDDTLSGAGGNDELHGDFGDDDLYGGDGVDFLSGGEGHDALDGGADRDVLLGGDGSDTLFGGSGDDVLHGGVGADVLDGGDGDDAIILGNGDVAEGGAGADTFSGGDQSSGDAGYVTDFNPKEDRIEVIYDPSSNPEPMIEVQDFSDGSGADIILDGEVILSVNGAQGLDPNMIELRANS